MMRNSETTKEKLAQSVGKYDWDNFRPSILCGAFRFALQLTLLGCCGSFLFGFNIALLNSAINVVASEFQMCGKPTPFADYVYNVARQVDIESAYDVFTSLAPNNPNHGCIVYRNSSGVPYDIKCKGGYSDVSCSKLKWLLALLQCAIMITGTFGAAFAGRKLRNGRRNLFLIAIVTFSVGIISTLCSNSFSAIMWSRLIVGFGVGIVSVASPTYIAEMVPKQDRGKFGVCHQLAITIGILIPIILGIPLPDPKSQLGFWEPDSFTRFWWRFMVGLGMLPVILAFYLLALVYTFETPVFYVEQGRYKDAFRMYEKFLDKKDVDEEFRSCVENVKVGNEYKEQGLDFLSAISSVKYRQVILVGLLLSSFQQIGGINVFMTSSSAIFEKAGLTSSMQVGMSILMATINVFMTLPTIILIDRIGRRTILLYGSAFQFLCVVPCAIAYWFESDLENPTPAIQILAVVAVIGFVTFFAVGFGPIVWVYIFEIFPMEIKDAGSSIGTAVNWLSAIIIVFLANVLPNYISFSIFAFIQLIATIFIFLCVKETKNLPLGSSPYIPVENKAARTVMTA